jgi:hypothetical protein
MSFLTGLSLTAIIAAVVGFFRQVQQFLRHMSSLILFQKKVIGSLALPVSFYIKARCRKLPSGLGTFVSIYGNIDDSSLTTHIPFELPPQTGIWRTDYGTFFVSASGEGLSLVSLRHFSNPQGLIEAAINFQVELAAQSANGNGNFYVAQVMGSAGDATYDSSGHARAKNSDHSAPSSDMESPSGSRTIWDEIDTRIAKSFMYESHRYIKNRQGKDPLRGLFFDDPVHKMLDGLRNWFSQRKWYEDHGIPWRTGVMTHGPGGTGKSSLARATAQILGIPLYQFYLNTLTDREFMREWDNMATPCVVAFEDFDTVFHGREPVTVHKSLSFECVLNKISGISSTNGVLLMVNTNHIEHVDPALGQLDAHGRPTRPGRIDYILELKYTSDKVKAQIAEFVLGGWAPDLVEDVCAIGRTADFTAAQFQSLCIKAALERMAKLNPQVGQDETHSADSSVR